MIRPAPPRMFGALLLCGALLAGCSSTSTTSSSTTSSSAPGGVTESTGAPMSSTPTSGGDSTSALTGTWNGTWRSSSDASGTFSVTFTQTSPSLNGTLSISVACLDGAKVTGTVSGSSIEFGSVKGQCDISYKGSIDGDQMSGTYDLSGAAGGTWKASKA
jgi:hypothetical protein